ncbi:hypothetical protein D3C80_1657110 [compost metagenome]
MGDTRVGRQFGHGLTVSGQRLAVQCAQAFEQILCLCISGHGRYIKPHQLPRRHAPATELQRQTGEVSLDYLCRAIGIELLMLRLRPQSITGPWLQSPSAPSPLRGARTGNTLSI